MNPDLSEKIVCYKHPDRETQLRCSRCEKPICAECAVRTPTGYRCKECVRSQQKVFDTSKPIDYLIVIGIAAVLGAVASIAVDLIPFIGFFIIFIGPVVGIIIARILQWAIQKRRSKRLFQISVAAFVIGALIPVVPTLLIAFFYGGGIGYLLPLIWKGLFIFLAASSMYYQLHGIQIR